jgi:hypothetical protein
MTPIAFFFGLIKLVVLQFVIFFGIVAAIGWFLSLFSKDGGQGKGNVPKKRLPLEPAAQRL